MKMSVSKTDLENLGEDLTYSVNIVAPIPLNWEDIFYEVQEYLMGEHGSPTMKDPHRDLDGNLVFTDCDGEEFGLDGLVDLHLRLLEEGKLNDLDIWSDMFYAGYGFGCKASTVVSVKVSPKGSNYKLRNN